MPPNVEAWLPLGQSITDALRHDGAQRQPVGDPLGEADDITGDSPVFGGEHLPRPANATLDLVEDEQDAMLIAEPAQARQEIRGRHDVAPFALDRLDEDRRQLIRRADRAQQRIDTVEVAVANMMDVGHERGEPAALHRLRAAQATSRRRSARERRS